MIKYIFSLLFFASTASAGVQPFQHGSVVSASSAAATYVNKAGDTMTGALVGPSGLTFDLSSANLIRGSSSADFLIDAGSGRNLNLRYSGGGGSALFIDTTGKVGIGATSPQEKLHVSNNGSGMVLEGTNHFYIDWRPQSYASGRKAYTGFASASTNDFTIAAEVGNLILLPTSNVGIGTSSPASKLEVVTASGNNIVASSSTASGFGVFHAHGTSGGCLMIRDTDNAGWTECKALNGTLSCGIDADGICD